MTELEIRLQPKQRLLLDKMENVPVLFYGGARGGGKSRGMRDVFLIRRFKYPGTNCAIFRKTYPELEANHIRPLFQNYPELRKYYNDAKKLLTLPNGSTIEFCYAENDADIDRYQGREYDDLGIEEAGQWSLERFRTLHASNRSSKPGIKPRTLLTGNPGGVGHAWLKRLFVDKNFIEGERPEDYDFIQALVYDNNALMLNDPGYVAKLEANPNKALVKAWRDGDWDVIAGAFFTELRRDIHFVRPFNIPRHWKKFGAFDYGFNHPGAFGWFACDDDGNVYMYRELVKAGMRADQWAAEIKKHEDIEDLEYIVAGLDCWVTKNVVNDKAAPTIAEEFVSHGIYLSKAMVARVQGATQLRNYLAWESLPEGRLEPRFKMFTTCEHTFGCLTRMVHDEKNAEDVEKVDASNGDPDSGDDPYDMVRYGIMSRPPLADRPRVKHQVGSAPWAKEEVKRMEDAALEEFEKQKLIEQGILAPDDPWSTGRKEFNGDLY